MIWNVDVEIRDRHILTLENIEADTQEEAESKAEELIMLSAKEKNA